MKTLNIKSISRYTLLFFIGSVIISVVSCNKYLDAKPDGNLAVPQTVPDLQAILDARVMNASFPAGPDITSDYFYLSSTDWQAISLIDSRNDYIWDPNAVNDFDWLNMYTMILNANIVIDGANNLNPNASNLSDINRVKGAGYFLRGYYHFALANEFAAPYVAGGDNSGPGLPLKLKADITDPTKRSTVEQTYTQILNDLKMSAALLPVNVSVKTRPSKAAAYGAIARVYLVMGDYQRSGLYADSCLKLQSSLMNYNTISTTGTVPFPIFNDEVIFHSSSSNRGSVLSSSKEVVDTNLFASYSGNDLRKVLFFKQNTKGHVFKGDYGGSTIPSFGGLAVDEVYLIRAEDEVRNGNVSGGINDLNMVLLNRFVTGSFTPYDTSMEQEEALSLILQERFKELAYRNGIRWSDLRRLNQDPKFAKVLSRTINDQDYTLSPGDKRYTFLIPVSVVQQTGIEQNSR